jgi:hypothetical protein
MKQELRVCLQQRGSDAHKSNPLLDVAATCHWHVKYERVFLKKGLKKFKFEKEVPVWKILKNGCLLPDQRAECVGPETSRPPNGREVEKYFPGSWEGPLRERKLVKRPLTRPSALPTDGRLPGGPKPYIIQQKSTKKKKGRRGREESKRRSPVHTSVWRYILVLVV